MANILSQEEIDALLGGLSGGQIDTANEDGDDLEFDASIVPFDFADQDRYLRGRLPTLETIHDRFTTRLRMAMSTSLRRMVELQVSSQTICSFGDFSRSLEKPSSLHLLKMDPLKGQGLLVLPGRLILTLVDLMFGGNGKPIEIPEEREFTHIESRVINKVADWICKCYNESWSAVYPLEMALAGQETSVQFVNIAQPADPVLVVDCDVSIDGTRSSLSMCVPYATLEPVKDVLKGTFVEDSEIDQIWANGLMGNLVEARLDICAQLGTAEITGRELLNLKTGDVIQLNEDYEHPIQIDIEGVHKFWGIVGAHKSGRALQITGLVDRKAAH